MEIIVIGAGGWGTTVANLLANKGYNVNIWAYEKETVENINNNHENKQFLPNVVLSENLAATNDLSKAKSADIIVNAVPSSFVRPMMKKLNQALDDKKTYKLVSLSKGLEYETFKLMTEVIREELGKNVKVAALSGPNHAEEVSRMMPTATVIASMDEEILDGLVDVFTDRFFKPYGLGDELGIQICGAVKNVTAIAIGVCSGLNLGDNTKSAIMTLGLTEMNKIGKEFGVKRATFFGLAGVGDMIATCTSKHSRNRFFGMELAKGKSLEDIKQEMHGMVAEGAFAAKSVYHFSQRKEVDLPLTAEVYKVLYENKNLQIAIVDLLKKL